VLSPNCCSLLAISNETKVPTDSPAHRNPEGKCKVFPCLTKCLATKTYLVLN
jgi:hypothetical protein